MSQQKPLAGLQRLDGEAVFFVDGSDVAPVFWTKAPKLRGAPKPAAAKALSASLGDATTSPDPAP